MSVPTAGPWSVRMPDSRLYVLISANGDGSNRNGGIYVARTQGPDAIPNAELIVRAVNSHEVFEAALKVIAAGHGCPMAVAEDALAKSEGK